MMSSLHFLFLALLADAPKLEINVTVHSTSGAPLGGVLIALDEASVGKTDDQGSFPPLRVAPGDHYITASLGDFQTLPLWVRVEASQRTTDFPLELDLSLITARTEWLADPAEPTLPLAFRKDMPSTDLEGCWGRHETQVAIRHLEGDLFSVSYYSVGCLGRWLLKRQARYAAGSLLMNYPLRQYAAPGDFQQLFVTQIDNSQFLVSSTHVAEFLRHQVAPSRLGPPYSSYLLLEKGACNSSFVPSNSSLTKDP